MNRITSSQSRYSRSTASSQREVPLAEVQRRLTNGVEAGTITAAEAAPLQARLDALKHDGFERPAGNAPRRAGPKLQRGQNANRRAQKPQHGQSAGARPTAQKPPSEVARLRGQIAAAARNADVDVSVMATSLEKRITAGLHDGTLTTAEGVSLRGKLASLQARATSATTPDEKTSVARSFLQLGREVGAARRDADFDVTNRKAALGAQVTAGAADGSLTAQEAARLRARLAALGAKSGCDAFEQLDRSVCAERADRQVNVQAMGDDLSKKIAELQTAGALPRTLADSARSTLAELMTPGAKNVAARLAELRAQITSVSA
jgi:hypothetical protein